MIGKVVNDLMAPTFLDHACHGSGMWVGYKNLLVKPSGDQVSECLGQSTKESEQIFRRHGTKILTGDLPCETVARVNEPRVSRIAKGLRTRFRRTLFQQ
jgi:hypothetical protein